MLLHGLLAYGTLPLFHRAILTILLTSATVIVTLFAIFVITTFMSFVSDWVRNLFS